MSNFKTEIPVHIDRVKALLPPGSTVDKAEWNPEKQCVELHWHNGGLVTRFTYPCEFTLEQLERKKLPSGINGSEDRKKAILDAVFTPLTANPHPGDGVRGGNAKPVYPVIDLTDSQKSKLAAITQDMKQLGHLTGPTHLPGAQSVTSATKPLTEVTDSTKSNQSEKVAGKSSGPKKGKPARIRPAPKAAMAPGRSGSTGVVSQEQDGTEVAHDSQGGGVQERLRGGE